MVKKFELNFELKFSKKIEKINFEKIFSVQTYVKANLVLSQIPFTMEGGGGGVLGSQNQSCSEWCETWSHFGIFEIWWHLAGYPPWLDLAGYPPGVCPMAFWEMLQSIMGYGYIILEFLRSDDICEISCLRSHTHTHTQMDELRHHSDQISRSARETRHD